MQRDKFRHVLRKRMQLHPNDDYGIEKYWAIELKILSENIGETIDFLENECTGEEFIFISEIFEELVQKTQSKELIDCLYRVSQRFTEECKEYHIYEAIEVAKDFLISK